MMVFICYTVQFSFPHLLHIYHSLLKYIPTLVQIHTERFFSLDMYIASLSLHDYGQARYFVTVLYEECGLTF